MTGLILFWGLLIVAWSVSLAVSYRRAYLRGVASKQSRIEYLEGIMERSGIMITREHSDENQSRDSWIDDPENPSPYAPERPKGTWARWDEQHVRK